MENILDKAHELARMIKNSSELKDYQEVFKRVEDQPGTKNMVKDFEKKQFELQQKHLSGVEISKEEEEKLQELYDILVKDSLAAEYMMKQMKFALMMQDITKILGEATEIA